MPIHVGCGSWRHRAFFTSPANAAAGPLMDRLLEAVQPLAQAKKLGAFLLTLAPFFGPDRHQLDELAGVAAKLRPFPLAVEFRHRAWVEGDAPKKDFAPKAALALAKLVGTLQA